VKPPDAYDARRLEKARLQYEQGHKRALLYWLDYCLTNNVQVPPWIKQGLSNALDAAFLYRIKSWDEVFGELLPKGKRIATERRNREIFWDLFSRVRDLHAAGASIDEELFEKVGKEFGVGKTVASEIYYETGRAFIEELEEDKALDREISEENKK
jgi:hypothetical protein